MKLNVEAPTLLFILTEANSCNQKTLALDNTFTNPQVPLDSLPRYQELDFTQISSKYRTHELLRWGISLLILVALWVVALIMDTDFEILMGSALIAFLYLGFRFFLIWKKQERYGFALRERDIAFICGYLVNRVTVIPFERIQHVSTSQGVLEKLLKISTLHLFTAGGSGSDINIPGLEPELAKKIKEALVLKVDQT